MDVITTIIAVWGAIISTYLMIKEIQKDKRAILVFFDFTYLYDTYKLRILNINHRPITIVGIEVQLYGYEKRKRILNERIPIHKLLSHEEIDDKEINVQYPITFGDGDHKIIKLPRTLNEWMLNSDEQKLQSKWEKIVFKDRRDIEIYVVDIEGIRHLAKKGYTWNPRTDQVIG